MRPVRAGWLWHQIAARTQFFDQQVLNAVSTGVRQIVICGAGYDDRALRFRSPSVCYFELDHPATQADKSRRLRAFGVDATGLELAPADFRTDDVAKVLLDHGHDGDSASLFICEGLLVYLDQPTCIRLLAGLRSSAAPGSTLAVSLATHRAGIDSDQVTSALNARRRTGRSEPWRTILPVDSHLALIERAGWHVNTTLDAVRLDPAAIPGRTQLVTAAPT
jgi:methyltransferase (TIGR00027 family)